MFTEQTPLGVQYACLPHWVFVVHETFIAHLLVAGLQMAPSVHSIAVVQLSRASARLPPSENPLPIGASAPPFGSVIEEEPHATSKVKAVRMGAPMRMKSSASVCP